MIKGRPKIPREDHAGKVRMIPFPTADLAGFSNEMECFKNDDEDDDCIPLI